SASQVTYVLDRDLVRFLKFAGSVLAIFLVLGAYMFGIDLKKSFEVVQKTKEDTQTALRDAQKAGHESQGAELAIRGTKTIIDASANKIKEAQDSAQKSEQLALKYEGDTKKHLDTAQGLVNDIIGTRSQARGLIESNGKPLPKAAPLSPEQIERLVESKLLK